MRRRTIWIVLVASLAWPQMAAADVTAFIGLTPTPETRSARGFAFGLGLLIIGFEFEYARAIEDAEEGSPSLQTGSGNVLVQTPVEVAGMQLYATAGGGLYRERLVDTQETSLSTNVGGGAKIRLAGPLRLRLDYRVFRLRGDALFETYQRFYAGANLAF
jgi:hypothetical protein